MQGNFLEAEARGIDLERKVVNCTYTKPFIGAHFNERSFEVPYDILVVAVSFGVSPSLSHSSSNMLVSQQSFSFADYMSSLSSQLLALETFLSPPQENGIPG